MLPTVTKMWKFRIVSYVTSTKVLTDLLAQIPEDAKFKKIDVVGPDVGIVDLHFELFDKK